MFALLEKRGEKWAKKVMSFTWIHYYGWLLITLLSEGAISYWHLIAALIYVTATRKSHDLLFERSNLSFSIYPFCSKKRISAIDCGFGYEMEYFPCLAGQGLYNSTCNIILALQWLIQRFDIWVTNFTRRIMKKVGVTDFLFIMVWP